jgi:hypothetical protein
VYITQPALSRQIRQFEEELGANTSVAITALADEPVLRYAGAHPEWNAFWTFDPRPDGSHPPPGPYVHDMEEIVAYAAPAAAWRSCRSRSPQPSPHQG